MPRRWTPATTSPSPPSGASPVMPRSYRPSSARSARCSTSDAPAPRHRRHLEGTRPARSALPVPRLPPTLLACDAHHLQLGRRRRRHSPTWCWSRRAHHTLPHATPWEVRLNPVDRGPEFHPPPSRRRGRSTGSVPRGSGSSSDYRSSSSSTSSCALVSPGLHPDPDRSHASARAPRGPRSGSSARTRCADAHLPC